MLFLDSCRRYTRSKLFIGNCYSVAPHRVTQRLFFHDPDGFMIEICNCDNLPVVPIAGEMVRSCSRLNLDIISQKQKQTVVQL
ncbi:hypothetical protein HanRHA438_Chr01g0010771 [Helianthus annuus]|nr:hypothetical protein HanIR_Chr01g0011521 [Helianthus annuus]KAJ0947042.1 hypothetical protein HanRHA438_Chr01g0010771 [Helianthus annuus]